MRKALLTVIFILTHVISWGQRTYIKDDGYDNDIFITEETGEIVIHFQFKNLENEKDSTFLALDRNGCEEMHSFLKELRKTYKEWSRVAKSHKVTNYSRPMQGGPTVILEWKRLDETFPHIRKVFGPMESGAASINPAFVVSKDGKTWVSCIVAADDYKAEFAIGKLSFNSRVSRFDYKRIEKEYNKLRTPVLSKEELDSLFH